jgi:nucleotide-binding universal stress UspA family protein
MSVPPAGAGPQAGKPFHVGRILVGVDGSAGSREALRWAIDEAATRGMAVQAVAVWKNPYDAEEMELLWSDFGPRRAQGMADVEDNRAVARATRRLAATIAEVVGQGPSVDIETVVVDGDPADTLCRLSARADLLVVGTCRHVGLVGLLLGSVSAKCAHHARCPLVIVPAEDDGPGEAA